MAKTYISSEFDQGFLKLKETRELSPESETLAQDFGLPSSDTCKTQTEDGKSAASHYISTSFQFQ